MIDKFQIQNSNYYFRNTNEITKVLPGWVFFLLLLKQKNPKNKKKKVLQYLDFSIALDSYGQQYFIANSRKFEKLV